MWKHIKVDGTSLVCYSDGTIMRQHIITKKWTKIVSKAKGYWKINITNNKKVKHYLVSRVIASAFKKGFTLDSKLFVDHIDHNIHNNSIENLRCITNQQNLFNTNAKGYCKRIFKKKNGKEYHYFQICLMINNYKIEKLVKTEEEAKQGYLELKRIHHII